MQRHSTAAPTIISQTTSRGLSRSYLIRRASLEGQDVTPADRFLWFHGGEKDQNLPRNYNQSLVNEEIYDGLEQQEPPTRSRYQDRLFYENMIEQLQEFNQDMNPSEYRSNPLFALPQQNHSLPPQSSSTVPSPVLQPNRPIPRIKITPPSPEPATVSDRHWLPPRNPSTQHLMIPLRLPRTRLRQHRQADEENDNETEPKPNDGLCHDRRCRITRPHPPGTYVHSGHSPLFPDEWFGFSVPPPKLRNMLDRLKSHTGSRADFNGVVNFLHIHGGDAVVEGFKAEEEDDCW